MASDNPGLMYGSDGQIIGEKTMSDQEFLAPLLTTGYSVEPRFAYGQTVYALLKYSERLGESVPVRYFQTETEARAYARHDNA